MIDTSSQLPDMQNIEAEPIVAHFLPDWRSKFFCADNAFQFLWEDEDLRERMRDLVREQLS